MEPYDNLQGGATMSPPVALYVGGLREGTVLLPSVWNFAWEEAVSSLALHFLPFCHWYPSSYFALVLNPEGGRAELV